MNQKQRQSYENQQGIISIKINNCSSKTASVDLLKWESYLTETVPMVHVKFDDDTAPNEVKIEGDRLDILHHQRSNAPVTIHKTRILFDSIDMLMVATRKDYMGRCEQTPFVIGRQISPYQNQTNIVDFDTRHVMDMHTSYSIQNLRAGESVNIHFFNSGINHSSTINIEPVYEYRKLLFLL